MHVSRSRFIQCCLAFAIAASAFGAERSNGYRLETTEVYGSERMSRAQLEEVLGLTAGTTLDDDLVLRTRQRLLSLGLFRSAVVSMTKGSAPGLAKLRVDLEDDDSVVAGWGLGGEVGLTLGESQASRLDVNSSPLSYRLGLVSRNLFGELQRGAISWDSDSNGKIRQGYLAYGLPRYAREDVQFDAQLSVVDVPQRYLEAQGFGSRVEALWSSTFGEFGEFQYGPAMYVNREPHYAMPYFPTAVAGAKVGMARETRLRSFYPGPGSMLGSSILVAPTQLHRSVLELSGAQTFALGSQVWFTVAGSALAVGTSGLSARGEGRFDVGLAPHLADSPEQADLFLRLRAGQDRWQEHNFFGSAAVIGIRYHSEAFIGELCLQLTRSPRDIAEEFRTNASEVTW